MRTLIRTEWLKMRKYNAFWWILSITVLTYPGINYMFYQVYKEIIGQPTQLSQLAKLGLGNPFGFPEVWHTVAYFSSVFIIIPAIVVIMVITNEYTFRTHRQNIIDGWSRSQFITSKLVDVLIITLLITLLYVAVALVTGFANHTRLLRDTWGQSYYIGLFALQTFAQLSIAFLVGFLVRKAFLAMGIFLFYQMMLENIAVAYLEYKKIGFRHYLPIETSDKLIPPPGFFRMVNPENYQRSLDAIQLHVFLTIGLTALIWFICYRINKARDLK